MSKYGTPEVYSRFLRKDWLKVDNPRIKLKAFKPPKLMNSHDRHEVSCFETQNLNTEEVKHLAIDNNITLNRKLPVGHCSIQESEFPFNKVEINRNYQPERHINIIGWEKYTSKEDLNEVLTILAEKSSEDISIYDSHDL